MRPDFIRFTRRLRFLFTVLLPVITNAQSGPTLDHFTCAGVPTETQVGQPFPVTIQARDIDNAVLTNFVGMIAVTAISPQPAPKVLITEIETINTERVELSNVSTEPVDVSGWQVIIYDSESWSSSKVQFTIPIGTVCPAGGVFQVRDMGSYPGSYPAFQSGVLNAWFDTTSGNPVAVLVLDANGAVADFFCAVDAYPAFIHNGVRTEWRLV